MTQAAAQDKLYLEGFYTVESPEQVEIDFELAGPGSRFCALVIDIVLMVVVFISLVFFFALLAQSGSMTPMDEESVQSIMLAAVIILFFILNFGYFLMFEWVTSGKSLGKIAMQIRVIRDDGTPMSGVDVLLRNLLRVVDAFPVGYVVGGIVCFFHPLHKRLGDLAAGTIVVKQRQLDYASRPDKGKRLKLETFEMINPNLNSAERQTLQNFFRRREQLRPESRTFIAQTIADRMARRHGGDPTEPEIYLETLAQGGDLGA